ncbi:PnuC-like nicotinamide riboside transporter [Arthrobacter phage BruhMoment]|nr:PnuC-like nicotinamide riboside transporter [Arthrobacter phage BruhMoment]
MTEVQDRIFWAVSNPNFIWSVALAVVGLVGMHIAGNKSHWGWFIGLMAQLLWIIFATVTGQYGFYLSAVGYGLMYGKNWRKWLREKREAGHKVWDTGNHESTSAEDRPGRVEEVGPEIPGEAARRA